MMIISYGFIKDFNYVLLVHKILFSKQSYEAKMEFLYEKTLV